MVRRAQLRDVPLFATLPPVEIDVLAATVKSSVHPAGTVLCREGEPGNELYVVLAGDVEVVKALGTSQERVLGISGAGEFLGEMSLISPQALRSASIRVRNEAEILELTRADFDKLIHRYPPIAFVLLQVLSRRLRQADDATIRDLQQKNWELAKAYSDLQAAQEQLIEQAILARELDHAKRIQESMLPAGFPRLPGLDIGGRMLPARQVGGDFYDVLHPTADRLVFMVGDVSGKGIPAALCMAQVCTLLRVEVHRLAEPEAVLHAVNELLLGRQMQSMFVTLIYGQLDLKTHELTYMRAGHEFPLIWDEKGAALPMPHGRSHPLGLFQSPVLERHTLRLPPRASVLFYSDGVTEAMDEHGELFGQARLAAAAQQPAPSAQALCDTLVQSVAGYQVGAVQMDDVTVLAVRLTEETPR